MRYLLALAALAAPIVGQTFSGSYPKLYSPTQTAETPKLRTMAKGDSGSAPTIVSPGRQGKPVDDLYWTDVIARFNAVPYRLITDPEHIGVLAYSASGARYHTSDYPDDGISYVDFQVDDGPMQRVERRKKRTSPPLNPHSNSQDYWVTLNPSRLDDGEHVLRAVVVPHYGNPRVLDFPFVTNSGGTLTNIGTYYVDSGGGSDVTGAGTSGNPWATIKHALQEIDDVAGYDKGGWTIELQPGDYVLSGTGAAATTCSDRVPVTIVGNGAEGAVTISELAGSHAALNIDLLEIQNVTIVEDSIDMDACTHLFLHGCVMRGTDVNSFLTAPGNSWVYDINDTDVSIYGCESYHNKTPFSSGDRVLDSYAWYTSEDALTSYGCLVRGCIFEDNGRYGAMAAGKHPDLYQFAGPTQTTPRDFNFIAYNCRTLNSNYQSIYAGQNTAYTSQIKNIAIVQCVTQSEDQTSQILKPADHLVMLQNTLTQHFKFRCHLIDNVHIAGNIFSALQNSTPNYPACAQPSAADFANFGDWGVNCLADTPFGTVIPPNALNNGAATDPLYTDESTWDYTLQGGSPVEGTFRSILLYDINGDARSTLLTALGAYKGSAE